jgi:hypothetical protein
MARQEMRLPRADVRRMVDAMAAALEADARHRDAPARLDDAQRALAREIVAQGERLLPGP